MWWISACGGGAQASPAQVMDSILAGYTYLGPERMEKSVPGCEGYGQRGRFRFQTGGRVDFILPGSDTMEMGQYVLDGNRLKIESAGRKLALDVRDAGLVVHDPLTGTDFRRSP